MREAAKRDCTVPTMHKRLSVKTDTGTHTKKTNCSRCSGREGQKGATGNFFVFHFCTFFSLSKIDNYFLQKIKVKKKGKKKVIFFLKKMRPGTSCKTLCVFYEVAINADCTVGTARGQNISIIAYLICQTHKVF